MPGIPEPGDSFGSCHQPLQATFGGRNPFGPIVDRDRLTKSACKGLEDCLGHMMAVCTIDEIDMQCDSTMVAE